MSAEQAKIASVPSPVKAPLPALGGAPRAIVPTDFESAYRIANVVVKAGMAPKSFDTPEKATVAILHGLEVGLTPMAALQSIAVVNGMPTIWGDGMLALIQGSGLLEDMEEHSEIDDKGEWQYSVCTMKRKDRPTPVERMFTRVMAMKAGLLNKAGPWTQYPSRMGQMRARSWCARDLFPDVLRGLHNTEETMDMPIDITDRASVTTSPPAEPRRADFQPPQQEPERPAEEDGWELFDETGEMVGRFDVATWVANLSRMESGKITDEERARLLENNLDTAKKMKADGELSEENDEILAAIYAPPPAADEPATKDWSLPDNIVGQEKKLLTIYKLLDEKAATPADVEDLWNTHEAFLEKLGAIKKAAANQRFGDRKMAIAQAKGA